MGRRKPKYKGKRKPFKHGPKPDHSRPQIQKLDIGRIDDYRFELKTIIDKLESGDTIFANIYSKSCNMGIAEAKDYVSQLLQDETINKDTALDINKLLNEFSKFR